MSNKIGFLYLVNFISVIFTWKAGLGKILISDENVNFFNLFVSDSETELDCVQCKNHGGLAAASLYAERSRRSYSLSE